MAPSAAAPPQWQPAPPGKATAARRCPRGCPAVGSALYGGDSWLTARDRRLSVATGGQGALLRGPVAPSSPHGHQGGRPSARCPPRGHLPCSLAPFVPHDLLRPPAPRATGPLRPLVPSGHQPHPLTPNHWPPQTTGPLRPSPPPGCWSPQTGPPGHRSPRATGPLRPPAPTGYWSPQATDLLRPPAPSDPWSPQATGPLRPVVLSGHHWSPEAISPLRPFPSDP